MDGTNVSRLTHFGGPPPGSASWSPDGTEIVFDWLADGQQDEFVMNVGTREVRQVTDHAGPDIAPSWSSDGRSTYFVSRRSGRDEVWKVHAGGGSAAQITHRGGFFPQESADGKYVYYIRADVPATSLLRLPVAGGQETEVIRSVARRRYTLTRDGIYFQPADADQPVFSYLNLRIGESVPFATAVSFLTGSPISVSRDERWLYFMVPAAPQSDLMLARRTPEHDLGRQGKLAPPRSGSARGVCSGGPRATRALVGLTDELERASVARPHGREVPNVSRRESTNAEIFSEHHDRRVNEAQAKVAVSPANIHRACELIDSHGTVSAGAAGGAGFGQRGCRVHQGRRSRMAGLRPPPPNGGKAS